MKQAGQPARRPRSAATLHHLSEPKLQPLSKIMKVVQGLLRRNANSGSRLLDVSNFRMGEDAAQYIASLLPSLSRKYSPGLTRHTTSQLFTATATALSARS